LSRTSRYRPSREIEEEYSPTPTLAPSMEEARGLLLQEEKEDEVGCELIEICDALGREDGMLHRSVDQVAALSVRCMASMRFPIFRRGCSPALLVPDE
jgi:hypothetical protein